MTGTRFDVNLPATWRTSAIDLCEVCGGHGALTVAIVEIPFEKLSRRRQQAHGLGHRFHRNITTACPACDGHDRATAAAEQQAETTGALHE